MVRGSSLLLIMVLLVSAVMQAQVPGYVGKYHSVNIGTQVAPLTGAIAGDDPVYDILPKWQVSTQYVVGKRLAIGADFTYRLENMDMPFSTYGDNVVPVHHDMYTAGIYFRNYTFYASGAIAPIGNYYTIHAGINSSYVHDEGQYLGINEPSDLGRFKTIYLGSSYGYQTILWDNFLLDRGIRFNLNVLSLANYFSGFDNIGTVRKRVGERYFINYGIVFYVSVGILTL